MSISSTVSIPLIPIGESSQRAIVFTIELQRGKALFPAFPTPDIITGLVYMHTTIEPMVVQKLDEKNTLLVFTEGKDIEEICNTLQSIKMWLGHSVNIGCNVAMPEQVTMGDQLCLMGKKDVW